jgi:pre-mRNA-splicing factor ATP-dependent RNA helicase DHX15/PRP43
MSSSNIEINPLTTKAYSANYFVLRKVAQNLPVSQQIPRLLSIIKQHNIVVVVGETGSGKTTQLPKAILLDDEFRKSGKKIALTQNRRLAAQLVSRLEPDFTQALIIGNNRSPTGSQRRWMCKLVMLSV